MRLLRIIISTMLLLGLFFLNLGSINAVSDSIVLNPDDKLVLVNKTYQLPSDYVPEALVTPDVTFSGDAEQLRTPVADALESMFSRANQDGIELRAASGYRSYDYQKELHQYYVNEYGEGYANEVSAQAGHSEHQTGLAIDVTTPAINNQLTEDFADTEAGIWIKEHAHEYGFIIRYPQGKQDITGYKYEPWHLRFVGIDVASHITENEITLEEYHNENMKTKTYTIQPGDSFWGIAQNNSDITVQQLLDLNPTSDPYSLQIGMDIYISKNVPSNEDTSSDENETYTIKAGDTLWEIAISYENVSVDELKNANPKLDPYALPIGAEIVIPN